MQQYKTFTFDSYAFDPKTGQIKLNYVLSGAPDAEDIRFTETLQLPRSGMYVKGVSEELLDRALLLLHLIGGVSYFKTCLPRIIEVKSGTLTIEQADFWNAVYKNGLGQFFYENDVDCEGLVNVPGPLKSTPKPIHAEHHGGRTLVPIGGGKDSLVTVELLRDSRIDCTLLRLGPHPLIEEAARRADLPLIAIERHLSPNLFELNELGALNGHVPITAYIHCLSVVVALLYGFDFVAFSNERSASIGNVTYKGRTINHQWSKSMEFEQMFQEYVATFLTPDLHVFSLLRSMNELTIAGLFSRYSKYFNCFTSCNRNWKIVKSAGAAMNPSASGPWCCNCPKCAFVFIEFAAFLPTRKLVKIFGKNLLEDASLIPLFRKLLGLEGFKPFECVGTSGEVSAAFILALKKNRNLENTPVMQMFLTEKGAYIVDSEKLIERTLEVDDDHAIPVQFLSRLNAHSSP